MKLLMISITLISLCLACDLDGGAVDPLLCGNDALDEGEECDGERLNFETCASFGMNMGALYCSECRFDVSGCYNVLQQGTSGEDEGRGIAVGDDTLVIAGSVAGVLPGLSGAGASDWYAAGINAHGEVQWRLQGGSPENDYGNDVAIGPLGEIFVAGATQGSFSQSGSRGGLDVALVAISEGGTLKWQRTSGSEGDDTASAVGVLSDGRAVVAGATSGEFVSGAHCGGKDAFVALFDTSGELTWVIQFGSEGEDEAMGVAVGEDDTIYVTGYAEGSIDGADYKDGADIFLTSIDPVSGARLWTSMWGNYSYDSASSVRVNKGQVYVVGFTDRGIDNNTSEKEYDAFVTSFTSDGTKLWTHQFGSKQSDRGVDVGFDEAGGIYVTGVTDGPIEGAAVYGMEDIFLTRLSAEGEILWNRQWGTSNADVPMRMVIKEDVAHIVGYSFFMLDGEHHFGYGDMILLSVPLP